MAPPHPEPPRPEGSASENPATGLSGNRCSTAGHHSRTGPPPPCLKVRAEFLRAAARGRKAAVHGLVLQAFARDDADPLRVGYTVTKKVGNAVVRNRTRRRLREAARLLLAGHALPGVDLVLIGRDATRGRPFAQLVDDLGRALVKAGVRLPDAPT